MADSDAVFNVGALPDGTLVQSMDSESPDDDTVVWIESDPDTKMSGAEMMDLHEDLVWAAEPVPAAQGAPWMDGVDAAAPSPPAPAAPPTEAVTAAAGTSLKAMIAMLPAELDSEDPDVEPVADLEGLDMLDDDDTPVEDGEDDDIPDTAPVAGPSALAVDGGLDPSDLHMTMKFLGDADRFLPEHRQAIQACVGDWASAQPASMLARVSGAGYLGDDQASVLHLEADGLHDARADLEARLAGIGLPADIDISDTYPTFMPHVTTGYGVDPSKDRVGQNVMFDRAAVQFGDEKVEYPFAGAKVAAFADPGTPAPPMGGAVPAPEEGELSEGQIDEVNRTLDEAEARIGDIQASIAYSMLGQVTDSLFVDDDEQSLEPAKVASMPAFPNGSSPLSIAPLLARIAALPDDIPEAIAERVRAITMRLDELDEQIAKMIEGAVDDEEMIDTPDDGSTYVDETAPDEAKTAGFGGKQAPPFKKGGGDGDKADPLADKIPVPDVAALEKAIKAGPPDGVDEAAFRKYLTSKAFSLKKPNLIPAAWKK